MRKHRRNKPDPSLCNDEHQGWYCVLAKGHIENHEVRHTTPGGLDILDAAWTQDGVEVPV